MGENGVGPFGQGKRGWVRTGVAQFGQGKVWGGSRECGEALFVYADCTCVLR